MPLASERTDAKFDVYDGRGTLHGCWRTGYVRAVRVRQRGHGGFRTRHWGSVAGQNWGV